MFTKLEHLLARLVPSGSSNPLKVSVLLYVKMQSDNGTPDLGAVAKGGSKLHWLA